MATIEIQPSEFDWKRKCILPRLMTYTHPLLRDDIYYINNECPMCRHWNAVWIDLDQSRETDRLEYLLFCSCCNYQEKIQGEYFTCKDCETPNCLHDESVDIQQCCVCTHKEAGLQYKDMCRRCVPMYFTHLGTLVRNVMDGGEISVEDCISCEKERRGLK